MSGYVLWSYRVAPLMLVAGFIVAVMTRCVW